MATVVELREFKADDDLVLSVIKNQAGTIAKAVLEGVMNSVDSKSKAVHITFGATSFEIRDNGEGFKSIQDIDRYFETFGTRHIEGDAKFGRFRVGRGQLMSFGTNVWRSGKFEMHTDVKNEGRTYKLLKHDYPAKGCKINVTLYKPLDESELAAELRDLKDLVAFVEIPVYLNGKCVSTSPEAYKWDFQDDDAYYQSVRVESGEEPALRVYNLGVKVCEFPMHRYGVGGVVVSKRELKVNMARNDIQANDCVVWERIARGLKTASIHKAQRKQALSAGERKFIASQIGYNHTLKNADFVLKLKLITTADGRLATIEDFLTAPVISLAKDGKERIGGAVHRAGRAFVITEDEMCKFAEYDLPSLVSMLEKRTGFQGSRTIENLNVLARHIDDNHYSLADSDLPAEELQILELLRQHNEEFVSIFKRNALVSEVQPRELQAGKCDTALAWTDGEKYIRYDRKTLRWPLRQGVSGFMQLLTLQTHEYSHDQDDYESHEHSSAFYQKFHDIMVYDMDKLAALALKMDKALTKLKPAMENRVAKKSKVMQQPRKSSAAEVTFTPARVVPSAPQATAEELQHAEFIRRQMPLFEQAQC